MRAGDIPTWAMTLPRGVGVVGGGEVEAAQPHQTQEDQRGWAHVTQRLSRGYHHPRGRVSLALAL